MAKKTIRILALGAVAALLLFVGMAMDWPVVATVGFVGGLVAVGMVAAAFRGSTYSSRGEFSSVDSSAEHSDSGGGDSGGHHH